MRERTEDISLLCDHFLKRLARKRGEIPAKFDRNAQNLLENYDWPGNVRELENLIERACVLSNDEMISEDLIEPWLRKSEPKQTLKSRPGHILEDTER